MTVQEALIEGQRILKKEGTDSPALDAALLLSQARHTSRERLYMDLAESLTPKQISCFHRSVRRRSSGEPVAWILGFKEFWGRNFVVGPGVLCPRPDSETLVEAALEIMDKSGDSGGTLHDCCCGPGTLAISLACERPHWKLSGSDISVIAAGYFRQNNQRLCDGRVDFTKSDLMEGINGPFDIIIANPPYLTPTETNTRVDPGWKEPALALNGGGEDGLDMIRRLVPRAATRLVRMGSILLEANPLQMSPIRQILSEDNFIKMKLYKDMAGRERVIAGCKK